MAIEAFTEPEMLEPEPKKLILMPVYGPSTNITESYESLHQYEMRIMGMTSRPDVVASPQITDDPTIV
jgi:hypothetical protein